MAVSAQSVRPLKTAGDQSKLAMGPICWLLIFQLLATGTNDKRCGRAAAQVQETGVNENAGKNWETGLPEMGWRAGDGGGKSNGKFAVVEIVNKGGSR